MTWKLLFRRDAFPLLKINPRTYTQTYTPVVQGGGGGGVCGVTVFRKDFTSNRQPGLDLTKISNLTGKSRNINIFFNYHCKIWRN